MPADFPFAKHEEAERRAIAAAPECGVANAVGPNPSTNVWLVARALRASGR
ncbi:hypothetical protein [Alloactinosynnema sp. L-07]|uniref:hypothetical protein n=1 Tax=Alloactinosynnema sp. L-07 TaxID=1653480 RepID=UPI00065F0689|nr:hypothetical protein [Alloactinosynnema sp. L-07]CRK59913.1 hypothetical protein [Alloactinosynnema sp. L-07]